MLKRLQDVHILLGVIRIKSRRESPCIKPQLPLAILDTFGSSAVNLHQAGHATMQVLVQMQDLLLGKGGILQLRCSSLAILSVLSEDQTWVCTFEVDFGPFRKRDRPIPPASRLPPFHVVGFAASRLSVSFPPCLGMIAAIAFSSAAC